MEILNSVRRLYISFKSLVNDFVYSFGHAALLLLVEVQNHTVPVRERGRIRVICRMQFWHFLKTRVTEYSPYTVHCLFTSHCSCYKLHTYDYNYSEIRVFNSLPSQIKDLSHNRNQFKHALKNFLYFHSLYTLDEYFSCNRI